MAKKNTPNHMHVLVLSISVFFLLLSFWFFSKSSATAGRNLNSGKQLNANQCDTNGNPLINITEKIVNTVDSGEGGNYWAFDNINRQIKVWQNSENTFCAVVQNEGSFDSQVGEASPGDTGVLTGDEDGSFTGGYRAEITGALRGEPGWSMKGNVGTHNYNCDINGNCPNYVNWVDQYFGPGTAFSYEWWGWTYQYKGNTWVNSSDGNSGDII